MFRKIFTASVLSAGLFGATAMADSPYVPREQQPQQQNEVPAPVQTPVQAPVQTPVQTPAYDNAALSDEGLKQVLVNLGYDVKTTISANNVPVYTVVFKRNDWTFVFDVALSSDKSNLWISSPLTRISNTASLRSDALLALLQKNYSIGPVFFSFSQANSRVYISDPMKNRDLTPARLRGEIENFINVIMSTESLWSLQTLTGGN